MNSLIDSKSKKNENEFSDGDLVFAKVKGHPWWPARITSIDRETHKNVVKYKVIFFATNESSNLNKSDICFYSENKLKYTLNAISLKHKLSYKKALSEIGKEFEQLQMSPSTSLKNLKTPTHEMKHKALFYQSSTPKISNSINLYTSTEQDSVEELSLVANTASVGTSTPPELDLNVQLDALTDKCILLEKTLIDKENQISELSFTKKYQEKYTQASSNLSEDYHTKILKQELSKYKLENKNLNKVVEILQNEKTSLVKKLQEQPQYNEKCLHCFPLLNNQNKLLEDGSLPHLNSEIGNNSPQDSASNLIITRGKNEVTQTKNLENQKPAKHQLLICADSHGRYLRDFIQPRTVSTNVFSVVKSGAKFNQVVEGVSQLGCDLGKNDQLLVLGGTNDIETSDEKQILEDIHKLIMKSQHTNLLLAALPMRHDMPGVNYKIMVINATLEKWECEYQNVNVLPLHLLPRHYFTTHGLHLNKKGKAKVAESILKMLEERKRTLSGSHSVTSQEVSLDVNPINVVNGKMDEVMKSFKSDPSIAFSHTISADFEHPRHMSGGVAVQFREKFGRPDYSDYIGGRLTAQKIPNGAVIYSLVTKSDYFGKPKPNDYDTAFKQLTRDFKRRGLKTLLCSPMGCIRDLIEIDQFAKNIVEFQTETEAKVNIFSYDQESYRVLRRGISHPDFLKQLKEKIEVCVNIKKNNKVVTSTSEEEISRQESENESNQKGDENCTKPTEPTSLIEISEDILETPKEAETSVVHFQDVTPVVYQSDTTLTLSSDLNSHQSLPFPVS